ncbi:MAG: tRNA pseudouridine(38-40) synthase TruA [Gemmatimonadota bacterium]|nr:MAG: tRNA pseudouridine(38-40) synthase TruA [Gemmatimonadota bacterium]
MFRPVAREQHHTDHWRVKLVLHYDGRDFHGWQIQPGRRTVQGELSSLLGQLFGDGASPVTGAGRTDQGVHATGQVASTLVPARWTPDQLRKALNALAPSDLWIASAERVSLSFHPRYDARSRTYVYHLGLGPEARSPFHAPFCWPLWQRLEIEPMRLLTATIVGEHDFGAFAKAGQPERGVRCRVLSATWREGSGPTLDFEITADRYLHRMVRYLVGTLVDIGRGRRPVDEFARLLRGDPSLRVSPPAPPQGLLLTRVEYSKEHTESQFDAQGERG